MIRRTRYLRWSCLLALVFWLSSSGPTAQTRTGWEWEGVRRVVALGDVHGRYAELVRLLLGTPLVDNTLNWVGGSAHLVLCGDLVDRGPRDRAVLDLVRRLQTQARSAGGEVHALLGNHEVMNLIRDFRYVTGGGYAAFAEDERNRDRRNAWNGYERAFARQDVERARLEEAFDETYPPGYFARLRAFGERGDYGRWLLNQPTAVKINGLVFLHGGLTPDVAAAGLEAINREVRDGVRRVIRAQQVLEDIVIGPAGFAELLGAATQVTEAVTAGQAINSTLVSAAEDLLEAVNGLALAPHGPLWYRRNSLANERVERDRVTEVLERLDARGMMLGHTVTRTGTISTRFNGRVYRGDVGMGYGRRGFVLVWEDGRARVFGPATGDLSDPVAEPPYGEGWSSGYEHLPDTVLERFLRKAEVSTRTEVERGGETAEIWELEGNGLTLRAVFTDASADLAGASRPASRYQHELAAYWVDHRLGVGFVPVVVEREVDGRSGALRAVVETAIDVVSIRSYLDLEAAEPAELIRAVAEEYGVEPAELEEQVVRARVFDGLIGKLERQELDALFVPGEGRVTLVNHRGAFGATAEIRARILDGCRPLPADLDYALTSLERAELETNIGDYLSPAQIDALLARRDRLLTACAGP